MPRVLDNIDAAFQACDIRDGATLSFHHHLRNGDAVLNAVLDVAARRRVRDLHIAPSSVFPCHAPLVEHIRNGVVTQITTSYMRGPVALAVSQGLLPNPVTLQSHGRRAAAITSGALPVDVAFIAAPMADEAGNLTGALGQTACGPLGYAMVDGAHARQSVALAAQRTATLAKYEIPGHQIQYVVPVDSIGDPSGISSGTTHAARDAGSLELAAQVAKTVTAAGAMSDGMSVQTGAGGVSLASITAIGAALRDRGLTGGFISGGICGSHVDLVRAGIFDSIRDVQCFDQAGVASFAKDPWHSAMSAAEYASPDHPNPVSAQLDVMILGASEIDRDFNINVTTSGDGTIIGGPGGHPDTAEGASLTLAVTRLTASGFAKVVDRVGACTTPGQCVDILVTDAGVVVNPIRPDLLSRLQVAGLPVVTIDALISLASNHATRQRVTHGNRVVAQIQDRHGGILDRVYQVGN